MMVLTTKMCSVSARKRGLRVAYLLQRPTDQVVNGHGSKSVAEGVVALVNASNIVASRRTENADVDEHWAERICDMEMINIRVPPNVPLNS